MTSALSASPVGSIEGQWWVCQTRPRYERRLADDLGKAGMAHYLPMAEEIRSEPDREGRIRRRRIQLPAFPCYVFVCGDVKTRYAAARSIATVRTIKVANQVRFRRELAAVETLLGIDPHLRAVAALKAGIEAEVVGGPMMGHRGIIERIGGTIVYFTLSLFGQAIPAEIDARFVEPAN